MPAARPWRPLRYTEERGADACARIAGSPLGLRELCKAPGMPGQKTLRRWLAHHPDFRVRYEQARAAQRAAHPRRPGVSAFSEAWGRRVCERIAASDSGLPLICQAPDMPSIVTLYAWVARYPDFRDDFSFAKYLQVSRLAHAALNVALNAAPDAKSRALARLRFTALSSHAGRLRVRRHEETWDEPGPLVRPPDEAKDLADADRLMALFDLARARRDAAEASGSSPRPEAVMGEVARGEAA